MLKQPKKYYRGAWGKGRDRRKKSGFHREMALACNEEHLPFIRSKRNKQALYFGIKVLNDYVYHQ